MSGVRRNRFANRKKYDILKCGQKSAARATRLEKKGTQFLSFLPQEFRASVLIVVLKLRAAAKGMSICKDAC